MPLPSPTTPTTQVSALPGHTTSDEECPADLAGLTIRTDTAEELPYVESRVLSDDLARQLDNPVVLEGIHPRMTWWQRGLRFTSAISPRW